MMLSLRWLSLPAFLLFTLVLYSQSRVTSTTPVVTTGDPGKALFEKRCAGCHSLDEDREGPRLRDVYGRKAGSVHGFPYSKALESSQVVWNDTTLNQWLTGPDTFIPDSNMSFYVPKPSERADIIRYLKVISKQQPAP
jgi:cytochrome c